MTVYILTGHLGAGKTLYAVKRAGDYMESGKRVASNITFNLDKLCQHSNKTSYTKLPLIPRGADLHALGRAYEGDYDERKNGLVILDESGTWLNSHDWKDKDRRELFRWVTHARKLGWDVILIIQDYHSLDRQIRDSVSEVVIKTLHVNRLVPLFGNMLPKIYMAVGRYYSPNGPVIFRHYMRGTRYYNCYDTRQAVLMETSITDDGEVIDARGSATMLSAWHLLGRYRIPSPKGEEYIFGIAYACLMTFGCLISILAGRSPSRMLSNIQRHVAPLLKSRNRFNVPELWNRNAVRVAR